MNIKPVTVALLVLGAAGCSSTSLSSSSPSKGGNLQNSASVESLPFSQSEFIDAVSAFILRVGQDVKAHGYTVIFTDIGPESMEEHLPDAFQELVRKSSGGGVQVRGLNRMREDGKLFRDKQTGERGVRFGVRGFTKQADGRFLVSGQWDESQAKGHVVRHTVIREGTEWKTL